MERHKSGIRTEEMQCHLNNSHCRFDMSTPCQSLHSCVRNRYQCMRTLRSLPPHRSLCSPISEFLVLAHCSPALTRQENNATPQEHAKVQKITWAKACKYIDTHTCSETEIPVANTISTIPSRYRNEVTAARTKGIIQDKPLMVGVTAKCAQRIVRCICGSA